MPIPADHLVVSTGSERMQEAGWVASEVAQILEMVKKEMLLAK